MEFPLHGRHFLKETDFTVEEWLYLLDLAAELKAAKKAGREVKYLVDKNIALIFEKTSTRTRCSFEVAAYDQGAHVTYLDPSGSQMGHKESVADTARVLGRFYDGIEFRGAKQAHVDELAALSGVPVWNGLTDDWHPTQMLADQLTMLEASGKKPNEISIAYVGDARNNVGNSILISCAMIGMDVRMVAPKELLTLPRSLQLLKNSQQSPVARSSSPTTSKRASRAQTSSTPTSGCRWVKARKSGMSASLCSVPSRLTLSSWQQPETRTSSSCTACLPSTTSTPPLARTSSRRPVWATAWK